MRLWPTRQKHKAQLVADLDALVTEPVAFKFNGKEHVIRPISTEEFFKFSNAYAAIWSLMDAKNQKVDVEQLISAYFEIFSSVCATISRNDVRNMSQAQAAALFQLITDIVSGRAHVDEKKTLQRAINRGLTADQLSTQ